MIADLIIVWPSNVDYPLFRAFIRYNRRLFDRVIIVFTYTPSGDDFRGFVQEAMKDDACLLLQSPAVESGRDWRDVAVNFALGFSTNEWVWFMEQDFYIIDEMFWREVDKLSIVSDVIGVKAGDRLHPCCLLLKRAILNRTMLNFGIVPDKLDHFGMIQKNLEALGVPISEIPSKYYHHMNGLSHNYYLANEMKEITYKPDEFVAYLEQCLDITSVPLDPRFVKVARNIVRN